MSSEREPVSLPVARHAERLPAVAAGRATGECQSGEVVGGCALCLGLTV